MVKVRGVCFLAAARSGGTGTGFAVPPPPPSAPCWRGRGKAAATAAGLRGWPLGAGPRLLRTSRRWWSVIWVVAVTWVSARSILVALVVWERVLSVQSLVRQCCSVAIPAAW